MHGRGNWETQKNKDPGVAVASVMGRRSTWLSLDVKSQDATCAAKRKRPECLKEGGRSHWFFKTGSKQDLRESRKRRVLEQEIQSLQQLRGRLQDMKIHARDGPQKNTLPRKSRCSRSVQTRCEASSCRHAEAMPQCVIYRGVRLRNAEHLRVRVRPAGCDVKIHWSAVKHEPSKSSRGRAW